jgi:hypothetical protein
MHLATIIEIECIILINRVRQGNLIYGAIILIQITLQNKWNNEGLDIAQRSLSHSGNCHMVFD